jgi:hypothetical protein
MQEKTKLTSNAYRTVSLSNPSVAAEVYGATDCLGYRTVNGNLQPTGFAPGAAADDPLDILITEENVWQFDR